MSPSASYEIRAALWFIAAGVLRGHSLWFSGAALVLGTLNAVGSFSAGMKETK